MLVDMIDHFACKLVGRTPRIEDDEPRKALGERQIASPDAFMKLAVFSLHAVGAKLSSIRTSTSRPRPKPWYATVASKKRSQRTICSLRRAGLITSTTN